MFKIQIPLNPPLTKGGKRHWSDWSINVIEFIDFPEQLKKIRNCPKKLYYRGEWNEELFEKTLVIVGSRRMTRYGKEIVAKFMPDFVINKLTIISGFMYGIDTEAHRLCLELGGKTVAVLGSGLDCLPTIENDELYSKILDFGGVVISEYEPQFKATVWSFPQRNRIVAGLATIGVLVVEAGIKSGSLITARIAKDQNRKVFTVPGPITSLTSEGNNWLLKNNWAKLVTESNDILENDFENSVQVNLFESGLDNREKKIVECLKREEMTMDEISRYTGIGISETAIIISGLLMKDVVKEEGGKVFL